MTDRDITDASGLLATGQISAVELTRAYLERIERLDPTLHCFITLTPGSALAEAAAADERAARGARRGPLDGIPIALKDNIDVAGVPCTAGIGARRHTVPATDAEAVRRLRAAGAVLLGKLNLHEAALGATTDNPHFGRTHNPHRPGYTPGGSSGGSGAAVAARLCAAALGTDTLGSVRVPASYCGVAGFKPTYGLVSTRGVVPLSWRLDHVGPLARSVRDIGLLLDAIAGYDAASPESEPAPTPTRYALDDEPGAGGCVFARPTPTDHTRTRDRTADSVTAGRPTRADRTPGTGDRIAGRPISTEATCDIRGLVLGRPTWVDAVAVEDDVRAVWVGALDVMRMLGVEVRDVEIAGYDARRARLAGLLISEAEAAVVHAGDLARDPDGFSSEIRAMLAHGRDANAERLVRAERLMAQARFAARAALADVDVLVLPTTPQPAFPFGTTPPDNQADLTALANLAGLPAVSVPMGFGRDRLPIGLQIVGRPWTETALLSVARAYERAAAWDMRPATPPR